MVRTPSCDQNGMKKGTWTPEEDRQLVAYVTRFGCWNWRQLPKFAGLKRCGKSCRLRWMNYLRPNLKRGNYTKEEEEMIIRLHESLGNRWSAIAAHLPGRTDNEIKNHWHTHLKKRIKVINNSGEHAEEIESAADSTGYHTATILNSPNVSFNDITHQQFEAISNKMDPKDINSSSPNDPEAETHNIILDGSLLIMSPKQSSSGVSTMSTDTSNTTSTTETTANNYVVAESYYNILEETPNAAFGDNFWTEPFLTDNSYIQSHFLSSLIDTEFLSPEVDASLLFNTGPGNNILYEEPIHAGLY